MSVGESFPHALSFVGQRAGDGPGDGKTQGCRSRLLDRYADAWADRFPEAYVKFKQLDYQNVPSLEFSFYGSDIDSLRAAGDRLMDRMRRMPELMLSLIHISVFI